jgi:hypothetical protein
MGAASGVVGTSPDLAPPVKIRPAMVEPFLLAGSATEFFHIFNGFPDMVSIDEREAGSRTRKRQTCWQTATGSN